MWGKAGCNVLTGVRTEGLVKGDGCERTEGWGWSSKADPSDRESRKIGGETS